MANKYLPEDLIRKYTQRACSKEEQAIVESWHIKDLSESTYLPSKENISLVNTRIANKLAMHIHARNKTQKIVRLWQHIALTASVLAIISIVTFLYRDKINFSQPITQRNSTSTNILPGGYKATLTLSNGNKVKLDGNNKKALIQQNDVNIIRKAGGKIVYRSPMESTRAEFSNTLETPRGGQYQLVLPDGTKVWLNSSTILTYPTAFTGKERWVKLIGEAFFEVAKNHYKPFKVLSNGQIVEVLGTHFNISAYPEENKTQTTLLEGKVKIYNHNISKVLKPGQEALTKENEDDILISEADIEKNMAWKNNEFIFNGENLKSIMRSISRWYDVDIVYRNYTDQTKYWGTVSRSKNISEVLKMLESTGKIKFKIEGRRIIAMN